MRKETRRERYYKKLQISKQYPISICTINFQHDVNLAYVIRSAACFGAQNVFVIGSHPKRHLMNELSGSMFDYVDIKCFANPSAFLDYAKINNIKLVSVELPEDENLEVESIFRYKFDHTNHTCLVVGHETIGVPNEILYNSDIVFIDMPGIGFCLNTAQAANISLYEAVRQFIGNKNE